MKSSNKITHGQPKSYMIQHDQTCSDHNNYVNKTNGKTSAEFLKHCSKSKPKKKPLFSHNIFALFLSNSFKVCFPETEVLYNIRVKWIEFFCSHMIVQNYNISIKKSTLSIKVACKLKCVVLSYHIYK